MENEQRNKLIQWKKVITRVLDEYKKVNKIRYAYIILKYFKRQTRQQIQKSLCIDTAAQNRIQYGIILDIAKYEESENLIHITD